MPPKERLEARQPQPIPMSWPTDENGEPLALISMASSELVGLPNYSNVTVGPAVVMRFVRDTPEARESGLKETAAEVQNLISEEREIVHRALKANSGS